METTIIPLNDITFIDSTHFEYNGYTYHVGEWRGHPQYADFVLYLGLCQRGWLGQFGMPKDAVKAIMHELPPYLESNFYIRKDAFETRQVYRKVTLENGTLVVCKTFSLYETDEETFLYDPIGIDIRIIKSDNLCPTDN